MTKQPRDIGFHNKKSLYNIIKQYTLLTLYIALLYKYEFLGYFSVLGVWVLLVLIMCNTCIRLPKRITEIVMDVFVIVFFTVSWLLLLLYTSLISVFVYIVSVIS